MTQSLTLTQKLNLANEAGYSIQWEPFQWNKLYWYARPDGRHIEVKGRKTQDKDSVIEAMYQDWKASQVTETHTDCRSETGITVGLIDAIITMSRLLVERDLEAPEVQEALKDLRQDEDLRKVLGE